MKELLGLFKYAYDGAVGGSNSGNWCGPKSIAGSWPADAYVMIRCSGSMIPKKTLTNESGSTLSNADVSIYSTFRFRSTCAGVSPADTYAPKPVFYQRRARRRLRTLTGYVGDRNGDGSIVKLIDVDKIPADSHVIFGKKICRADIHSGNRWKPVRVKVVHDRLGAIAGAFAGNVGMQALGMLRGTATLVVDIFLMLTLAFFFIIEADRYGRLFCGWYRAMPGPLPWASLMRSIE